MVALALLGLVVLWFEGCVVREFGVWSGHCCLCLCVRCSSWMRSVLVVVMRFLRAFEPLTILLVTVSCVVCGVRVLSTCWVRLLLT